MEPLQNGHFGHARTPRDGPVAAAERRYRAHPLATVAAEGPGGGAPPRGRIHERGDLTRARFAQLSAPLCS